MFTSIKAKIIVFYLMILFATVSVLGGLLYFSLNRIVYDAVDADLLSKAHELSALTSMDAEDRAELKASEGMAWEYGSPKATSFYQIRRLDGSILERSASLQGFELPYDGKAEGTTFRTVRVNGLPLRLVILSVPGRETGEQEQQQGYIIQCAEKIQAQRDLLQRYRLVLFFSIFAVMVISALGGVVISRKALAPVKNISRTIDAISESNLSERIDVERVPEELRILASSFNRTVDRLGDAFRRQNQFAADASHELRTPLSVILSQSEIALRKERTAEEYRTALSAVLETAQNMSATVRKLLALNRLQADKSALHWETLDLGALIDESVRLLGPLAERREVRVQAVRPEGQLRAWGDRVALLELLSNLLDNAIKYNVPGGKVQISATKKEEFILCEIRDTGIGIPEGDQDKVFDRFYRLDQSRSKEIEGSGLGLSICKEIVRLHGGRIAIQSRKGEGTTVSVFLRESG
jgi:heavy metal sensor kinase